MRGLGNGIRACAQDISSFSPGFVFPYSTDLPTD